MKVVPGWVGDKLLVRYHGKMFKIVKTDKMNAGYSKEKNCGSEIKSRAIEMQMRRSTDRLFVDTYHLQDQISSGHLYTL